MYVIRLNDYSKENKLSAVTGALMRIGADDY